MSEHTPPSLGSTFKVNFFLPFSTSISRIIAFPSILQTFLVVRFPQDSAHSSLSLKVDIRSEVPGLPEVQELLIECQLSNSTKNGQNPGENERPKTFVKWKEM